MPPQPATGSAVFFSRYLELHRHSFLPNEQNNTCASVHWATHEWAWKMHAVCQVASRGGKHRLDLKCPRSKSKQPACRLVALCGCKLWRCQRCLNSCPAPTPLAPVRPLFNKWLPSHLNRTANPGHTRQRPGGATHDSSGCSNDRAGSGGYDYVNPGGGGGRDSENDSGPRGNGGSDQGGGARGGSGGGGGGSKRPAWMSGEVCPGYVCIDNFRNPVAGHVCVRGNCGCMECFKMVEDHPSEETLRVQRQQKEQQQQQPGIPLLAGGAGQQRSTGGDFGGRGAYSGGAARRDGSRQGVRLPHILPRPDPTPDPTPARTKTRGSPVPVPRGKTLNKSCWFCSNAKKANDPAMLCGETKCKRWLCHREECLDQSEGSGSFVCCFCEKRRARDAASGCLCHR